jgi:hypothetical protein
MVKDVPAYPAPPEPKQESVPPPMVRQHDPRRSRRQNPRRPRRRPSPHSIGPARTRGRHNSCRDGRIRPSRRPSLTGPQRTPLRHHTRRHLTSKAARKRERRCERVRSSEGANDRSP